MTRVGLLAFAFLFTQYVAMVVYSSKKCKLIASDFDHCLIIFLQLR